jgi:hypothetical protein
MKNNGMRRANLIVALRTAVLGAVSIVGIVLAVKACGAMQAGRIASAFGYAAYAIYLVLAPFVDYTALWQMMNAPGLGWSRSPRFYLPRKLIWLPLAGTIFLILHVVLKFCAFVRGF